MEKRYKSFSEFYPYYLTEHKARGTRILHFFGTSMFFVLTIVAILKLNPLYFLGGIVTAYFFAWLGHFFVERNKPATFQYPLWSLKGDFKLYFQIIAGKESLNGIKATGGSAQDAQ